MNYVLLWCMIKTVKDEVASSNLASSSKASEIFEFQRFSFAVVKIQLQKVQNRQFCENH